MKRKEYTVWVSEKLAGGSVKVTPHGGFRYDDGADEVARALKKFGKKIRAGKVRVWMSPTPRVLRNKKRLSRIVSGR